MQYMCCPATTCCTSSSCVHTSHAGLSFPKPAQRHPLAYHTLAPPYEKTGQVVPEQSAVRMYCSVSQLYHLTLTQISLEVYNEGALGGSEGARPRSTLGFLERPLQGERAFRVDLRLLFPEVQSSTQYRAGRCSARHRLIHSQAWNTSPHHPSCLRKPCGPAGALNVVQAVSAVRWIFSVHSH